MASNLAKRLDKLERLAEELLSHQVGPVYVRELGDLDPERAIVIRREYVGAPERADLTLPPSRPSSANADKTRTSGFNRTVEFPKHGVA